MRESFTFTTGSSSFSRENYEIKIFAPDQEMAERAWKMLQDRNYYPTGRVWYTETNSINRPTSQE